MAKVSTDKTQIEMFLTRAVENVYPKKEKLAEALASGKPLTIYYGIDPTGPSIHLGHLIPIRKFAELQKMGHKIILLIGDFTAMIGDPTDKLATRKQLTREEVLANCKGYKKQLEKIIDFTGPNAAELKFNSSWLGKMSFNDVVELASNFTVQQMLERDMFEKRIEEGKPVGLHEFLYPLMQGYDSVAMDVDMEVGGNDQTFNMLAGRTLQRSLKNREKFVLTTKLLVDPTGKKMGKSEGNMITLTDSNVDMYGKIMSWSDEMILPAFEMCTSLSEKEIGNIKKAMQTPGYNPMEAKSHLAKQIVKELISEEKADAAVAHFKRVHQEKGAPEKIEEYVVLSPLSLLDFLVRVRLATSKSDARRQIEQGGVKVNDVVVKDITTIVKAPDKIQKGKLHFLKLVKE